MDICWVSFALFIGHEGPQGEQRYNSTLSRTQALDGGEGQPHAPATSTLGKNPVPNLQEAEWAPGPVWTGGKSRRHWDSIPDRPVRSSVAIPIELPGPFLHGYRPYKIICLVSFIDSERFRRVQKMAHCGSSYFVLFTAFCKNGQTKKNGMSFYVVHWTR